MQRAGQLPASGVYVTEGDGSVLTVTLDWAERHSAISRQVCDDLAPLWPVVATDSTIRCALFTRAGELGARTHVC
jgi:enoyl-CoA hydratase/carnithine racemase